MQQTKLIHISDLHFALDHMTVIDMIRAEGLLSKRVLGWINYRLNRKDSFPESLRDRLLKYLLLTDWDYLIVTGDFTNLALEAEFKKARAWLEPIIQKGPVLLTPGNHDRYVLEALKPDLFKQYFADCFPITGGLSQHENINCFEISDQAVLFEIDMAVPRKIFSSRGKIKPVLTAYDRIINQRYQNHIKIVMGHYPVVLPPEVDDIYLHKLAGNREMDRFLFNNRIDLYLHGHIHKSWKVIRNSEHPITHINSGGCFKFEDGPWAGFHQITLKEKKIDVQKITI